MWWAVPFNSGCQRGRGGARRKFALTPPLPSFLPFLSYFWPLRHEPLPLLMT
ncbi:rCG34846 [Rattus norvegicus]|uniref:RCG34846 n=1 Tax=Rattus norvegicus TaxID=10116 RepID=A6HL05_RAT|nr:rCG34846 [Rattus norvegicus]